VRRRAVRWALLLALAPALLGAFFEWGGPAGRGVRELRERRFDLARRSLREGRADFPRSAALRYDEALALSGAGFPDSAARLYAQAHGLDGNRARASAAYNRGNLALHARRYAEAAAWYRDALRLSPGAADAKRNLEEAIRRMRGEPGPPPAAPGGGGVGRGGPQDRMPGAAPPETARPRGQDRSGVAPPPGSHAFTRAEAERWLEALERERRSGRRAPSAGAPQDRSNDRDW
jgi:tetratricopeptide (TPR) repeat protein